MKLASYRDGSRDGQLVVVSRDLASAHFANGIASRLQQALDDWNFIAPQLQELYDALNAGRARLAFAFDARQCMAPLPRSFRWAHGAAHEDRVDLVHGAGDAFLGPRDAAFNDSDDGGIEFRAGIAVVTGDVPLGAAPERALEAVRLVMLVNAWSASDPAVPAFGPVAVTPDELGAAWRGGRVHLSLQSTCNGSAVGTKATASPPFGPLIAHACRTQRIGAGGIFAAIEAADPRTVARHGDTVRIELRGADGSAPCGAIEQTVRAASAGVP